MKKIIVVVLFIFIILNCSKKNNINEITVSDGVTINEISNEISDEQKYFEMHYLNKEIYVSDSRGINVFDIPNYNGKIIAHLDYYTEAILKDMKRVENEYGGSDTWFNFVSGNIEGWAFAEYFFDIRDNDIANNRIVGTWARENNSNAIMKFSVNREWYAKGAGGPEPSGTYEITNNNLKLNFEKVNDEPYDEPYIYNYEIQFIDINKIKMIDENSETIYIRINNE